MPTNKRLQVAMLDAFPTSICCVLKARTQIRAFYAVGRQKVFGFLACARLTDISARPNYSIWSEEPRNDCQPKANPERCRI
jgi:hypothetical protein